MNGTAQERDLMNALNALGWEGVRSPASGTAPREQPDVLAAKRGVVLNAELKSGGPPRNPTKREVSDLFVVGEAFAAATVLVARWKGTRAFYFARPVDVNRTPSGHFSIPGAPERWPFEAVIRYSPNTDDDVDRSVDTDGVDVLGAPDAEFVDWVADVARSQARGPEPRNLTESLSGDADD